MSIVVDCAAPAPDSKPRPSPTVCMAQESVGMSVVVIDCAAGVAHARCRRSPIVRVAKGRPFRETGDPEVSDAAVRSAWPSSLPRALSALILSFSTAEELLARLSFVCKAWRARLLTGSGAPWVLYAVRDLRRAHAVTRALAPLPMSHSLPSDLAVPFTEGHGPFEGWSVRLAPEILASAMPNGRDWAASWRRGSYWSRRPSPETVERYQAHLQAFGFRPEYRTVWESRELRSLCPGQAWPRPSDALALGAQGPSAAIDLDRPRRQGPPGHTAAEAGGSFSVAAPDVFRPAQGVPPTATGSAGSRAAAADVDVDGAIPPSYRPAQCDPVGPFVPERATGSRPMGGPDSGAELVPFSARGRSGAPRPRNLEDGVASLYTDWWKAWAKALPHSPAITRRRGRLFAWARRLSPAIRLFRPLVLAVSSALGIWQSLLIAAALDAPDASERRDWLSLCLPLWIVHLVLVPPTLLLAGLLWEKWQVSAAHARLTEHAQQLTNLPLLGGLAFCDLDDLAAALPPPSRRRDPAPPEILLAQLLVVHGVLCCVWLAVGLWDRGANPVYATIPLLILPWAPWAVLLHVSAYSTTLAHSPTLRVLVIVWPLWVVLVFASFWSLEAGPLILCGIALQLIIHVLAFTLYPDACSCSPVGPWCCCVHSDHCGSCFRFYALWIGDAALRMGAGCLFLRILAVTMPWTLPLLLISCGLASLALSCIL
jgi:hypothetical protein